MPESYPGTSEYTQCRPVILERDLYAEHGIIGENQKIDHRQQHKKMELPVPPEVFDKKTFLFQNSRLPNKIPRDDPGGISRLQIQSPGIGPLTDLKVLLKSNPL